MKPLYSALFLFFFSLIGFSQTVELTPFGPTFSSPVEITHAGDSRLFVVEKRGVIKILNADGTVNPTPFLDIDNLINSSGERGLLGLAFAPDYATSGRFYVNYTDNNGDTVIARYSVSTNPDVANPAQTFLFDIAQPYSNHNGGKIAFGPDGFLYISTGDGGSGGDPGDRSQNPNSLLGKMLRIDVSGSTYTNPPTNPYGSQVYAIGLRNTWKFSFDKTTGDLWTADVGQNDFEEINKVVGSGAPADNYGWRCYEGNSNYASTSGGCPAFNTTVMPVSVYGLNSGRCSITGGYLYRGNMFPQFLGKYFFADYCSGEIGILTQSGSSWSQAFQTTNVSNNWATFGEDINGELYIAGGTNSGRIYKLSDPNLSTPESTIENFKLFPNPSKDEITIKQASTFSSAKTLTITNVQGQVVKTKNISNQQQFSLSIETLASGIYFVALEAKSGAKIIKKLIIN